jgi:putative Mn2+ efflux pump MntP
LSQFWELNLLQDAVALSIQFLFTGLTLESAVTTIVASAVTIGILVFVLKFFHKEQVIPVD